MTQVPETRIARDLPPFFPKESKVAGNKVVIQTEGREVVGQYNPQFCVDVDFENTTYTLALNNRSIKNIVDIHGKDMKNWLNRTLEAYDDSAPIGKAKTVKEFISWRPV